MSCSVRNWHSSVLIDSCFSIYVLTSSAIFVWFLHQLTRKNNKVGVMLADPNETKDEKMQKFKLKTENVKIQEGRIFKNVSITKIILMLGKNVEKYATSQMTAWKQASLFWFYLCLFISSQFSTISSFYFATLWFPSFLNASSFFVLACSFLSVFLVSFLSFRHLLLSFSFHFTYSVQSHH